MIDHQQTNRADKTMKRTLVIDVPAIVMSKPWLGLSEHW